MLSHHHRDSTIFEIQKKAHPVCCWELLAGGFRCTCRGSAGNLDSKTRESRIHEAPARTPNKSAPMQRPFPASERTTLAHLMLSTMYKGQSSCKTGHATPASSLLKTSQHDECSHKFKGCMYSGLFHPEINHHLLHLFHACCTCGTTLLDWPAAA